MRLGCSRPGVDILETAVSVSEGDRFKDFKYINGSNDSKYQFSVITTTRSKASTAPRGVGKAVCQLRIQLDQVKRA